MIVFAAGRATVVEANNHGSHIVQVVIIEGGQCKIQCIAHPPHWYGRCYPGYIDDLNLVDVFLGDKRVVMGNNNFK